MNIYLLNGQWKRDRLYLRHDDPFLSQFLSVLTEDILVSQLSIELAPPYLLLSLSREKTYIWNTVRDTLFQQIKRII